MSGNVWEWCWESENSGAYRVVRGGSWTRDVASGWPRVAACTYDDPNYRDYDLGFRVVLP
jgi:formylglycine-generating enzyme required for sulfatase activity